MKEIYHKEDGENDLWIVEETTVGEEDALRVSISEDNIANNFGFFLYKEDVSELRDILEEWLEKNQ